MLKICSYCIAFAIAVAGCNQKENKNTRKIALPSSDTSAFYDVKGFIQSEIKEATSTPYFIYGIIAKDGKRIDSTPLQNENFVKLAQAFLEKDIAVKGTKPYYKEDIFRDLSTNSVSISYTTVNKELDVQSVVVLVDDETASSVKYVFIRCQNSNGDSSTITRMNWHKGQSFTINKSITKTNGESYSLQQKVAWNEH